MIVWLIYNDNNIFMSAVNTPILLVSMGVFMILDDPTAESFNIDPCNFAAYDKIT